MHALLQINLQLVNENNSVFLIYKNCQMYKRESGINKTSRNRIYHNLQLKLRKEN
jgi:hypothetical protein